MKNIVMLLDGTSNSITPEGTNILRLQRCLSKDETQLVYYDPGVGTLGGCNAWARLRQKIWEIWGLATGAGIDENVKQAYRFLMAHYQPGDRIYLFGYSRGAYTARILGGLIQVIGLLQSQNANIVDYAYRAYKRIGQKNPDNPFEEIRVYQNTLKTRRVPIRAMGLFDTVGSVIEPGTLLWPQLKTHAYTAYNPSVETVRHALALGEKRKMFRPTRWQENGTFKPDPFDKDTWKPQDLKQVWFSGSHGDVGGGREETESHLAKVPLVWMIQEFRDLDLRFDDKAVDRYILAKNEGSRYCEPSALAEDHDSMTTGWLIAEFIPLPTKDTGQSAGLFSICRPRYVPDGATLHAAVIARAEKKGGLPPHVPKNHEIEGDPQDWRE